VTDFYVQIKSVHVTAVLASGTLFLLRGLAVQSGRRWAMAARYRYLSYGIDTVLLATAILLLTILPAALYANGWLTVKMILLVVYIALGTYALKRGRTRNIRLVCFAAAVVVYACMLSIARTHHPFGPIRWLLA
jgi:uncharacterized membrane protein SirB2